MDNQGNKQMLDETEPLLLESSSTNSITVITRHHRAPVLVNLFFLALVIIGQTGQSVTLPLWIDSELRYKHNSTSNSTARGSGNQAQSLDYYFFLFLPAFAFAAIFRVAHMVNTFLKRNEPRNTRYVEQKYLVPVGVFFGLGAVFVVFSASGKRTPPYLQSILANITIPTTLIIRFLTLKKIPTTRKLLCAVATILSLIVCLLPSMAPGIDPDNHQDQGGAQGVAGILWPLSYMIGFMFDAIANILQERGFSIETPGNTKPPDLIHALCWIELYQFVFLLSCFWIDAIPGFGSGNTIAEVGKSWLHGMQCFFGGDGCSYTFGLLGMLFICMLSLYLIGAMYLLSGEGATYLVIVQSIVTPLGFLFWTLFKEQPHFHWGPEITITSWLSIAGLVIIIPSVYFYNTGPPDKTNVPKDKGTNLPC